MGSAACPLLLGRPRPWWRQTRWRAGTSSELARSVSFRTSVPCWRRGLVSPSLPGQGPGNPTLPSESSPAGCEALSLLLPGSVGLPPNPCFGQICQNRTLCFSPLAPAIAGNCRLLIISPSADRSFLERALDTIQSPLPSR